MKNEARQTSEDVFLGWCKLLDPNILRTNLHAIGVYLVAFEILKTTVIDHPRDFFTMGLDDDDSQNTYNDNVLSRDRSPFRASMLWFKEMGAINDADIATSDEIRRHRNDLAHEIPKYLAGADTNIDISLFHRMLALLSKIDSWWIREVELECNPNFNHVDKSAIPDEEVISGNMLLMQMILDRTFGDLEAVTTEYETFVKGALSKMESDRRPV